MGFYGNYLKINAGEGLVVEEKGQEIDINLAPQMLNLLSSKSPKIRYIISSKKDFEYLVKGYLPNLDEIEESAVQIGDCFYVANDLTFDYREPLRYNYYGEYAIGENDNLILSKDTIITCVEQYPGQDYSKYFDDYNVLVNKVKVQPIWNNTDSQILKFYNEEVESDIVENDSIIVDRENQTISVKKDGEKIVVGNVSEIGLEKGNNGKGLQSVDSENQIQAENSFGFGKGLKNTESNVNQFIRGQYNKVDEKNEYIDLCLPSEHHSKTVLQHRQEQGLSR